ncbi:MAG: FG-GAP-like repeat-containing protein [Caldilineaceae bacterium]
MKNCHCSRYSAILFLLFTLLLYSPRVVWADSEASSGPRLSVNQQISQEPLLGGQVIYQVTIVNNGSVPVTDKGYNLTISDTLPSDLIFVSASPSPTLIVNQSESSTRLEWGNIADLEVNESLTLNVVAQLKSSLTTANSFVNKLSAKVNTVPDNSGKWIEVNSQLSARPQAIDIEMEAQQSTAGEQASGAGEYPNAPGRVAGADWPYRYKVTIRNNAVSSSQKITTTITLPPGVAYLGNPTFSSNPNKVSVAPQLTLKGDGSLLLKWGLGNLSTSQYNTPIVITFDAAVPYRYRTGSDKKAADGPFAGPMSGDWINEDSSHAAGYEAVGTYANAQTSDGSESTREDDAPCTITSEILTVRKTANPTTVGIGSEVSFALDFFVSEYYTVTNGELTDILPDGMTYIEGSASLLPRTVLTNTPATGQTSLIWDLPPTMTVPGKNATVTFRAKVDAAYEATPRANQPIVSGDSLTNQAIIDGDWQDVVTPSRTGTTTPDSYKASMRTRMPTFSKLVLNPLTNQWGAAVNAFVGDTVTFKLNFNAANDVDAREVIIRDFLPRGMGFVAGSSAYVVNGTYNNSSTCTAALQNPLVGNLSGLTYLEWRLCNVSRGATWQVQLQAKVEAVGAYVQPNWIVANFGKMSGQNSYATGYSLRELAVVNYKAPRLVIAKSAKPSTNLKGGEVVTYTIQVENDGSATAYNISLIDTLPPGLIVAANGGSASPTLSSYTTISGTPSAGSGGRLQWATIPSLAVDKSETFVYVATVATGQPAGKSLTNLASISYNSRADNTGHPVATTNNPDDEQTDDATVYIKGVTLDKSANRDTATIGDKVHWILTGTVPVGVRAYWPVVEENDLPQGFDYITKSTVISGALLDLVNHNPNPLDSGDRDLRWFLQNLDNTNGVVPLTFTIQFDTLVTGVKGDSVKTVYYTSNCCLEATKNNAYVGWYDATTGYTGDSNPNNGAWHGYETNRIDRRSPVATYTLNIAQPYLTLQKSVSVNEVNANDLVEYTLWLQNNGNATAYDIPLQDLVPAGLTLQNVAAIKVEYPAGFPTPDPAASVHVTDSSIIGSGVLSFTLDRLYVGATVSIRYLAKVNSDISASLLITNTAKILSYTSQPGVIGDSNGDKVADERSYNGTSASVTIQTPAGEILKKVSPGELTYGSNMTYTLLVPAKPLGVTLYNVVVTDIVNSSLTIVNVGNGASAGNLVTAKFASVPPNTQQRVTVTVQLLGNSSAMPNTLLSNQAFMIYTNGGTKSSNEVTSKVVAPALVVVKQADHIDAKAGDTILYSIRVQNVGNGRAEALVVSDLWPNNMKYVAGSATLNGAPWKDPDNQSWSLPTLQGKTSHLLTYQMVMVSAEPGQGYLNVANVKGKDSRGLPIVADQQSRFAADIDPDDSASAIVYGPLEWKASKTFVAYEDLKNTGWSDWDYNDFIVKIEIEQGVTPKGNLAGLRINYEAMAHGGSFNHQFLHLLPVTGGGTYAVTDLDADGNIMKTMAGELIDEQPITIFDYTKRALPVQSGTPSDKPFTNTLPDQKTAIKGWTAQLQVALFKAEENPVEALLPVPWDPYLYVYATKQEIHLLQPGQLGNTQVVNNVHDKGNPMVGFDLPLAQTFDTDWLWPQEFIGIWRVYPEYVKYAVSNGASSPAWWDPNQATTSLDLAWKGGSEVAAASLVPFAEGSSRYYAAPVVADLDNDGAQEIIIGNLVKWNLEVYNADGTPRSGWPQLLRAEVKGSATVADIDNDGVQEILVGDGRGYLHIFHANGQALSGWPVLVGSESISETYRILSRPAVADLDGDNSPDVIVASSNGQLYVYSAQGQLKTGWPVSLGDAADKFGNHLFDSSPVITDLDGNGSKEIVVGSYDKQVYAYHADGTLGWSFATKDAIVGTPEIADVDPSHPGLEVAIGSGDRYLYLLDSNGILLWKRPTGWIIRSSPLLADLDGDGSLEVIVGSEDHKIWAWHADGSQVAGWPQTTGAVIVASPVFGDVDGDGQAEVIVAADDAEIYAWHGDGTLAEGWPQESTAPVKGAAALANLDDDAAQEVVVANIDGQLLRMGIAVVANNHVFLPMIAR